MKDLQDRRMAMASALSCLPVGPDDPQQRFKAGQKVRLKQNGSMGMIPQGSVAVVLYTYSQKYSSIQKNNFKDYALQFERYGHRAWFNEDELEACEE